VLQTAPQRETADLVCVLAPGLHIIDHVTGSTITFWLRRTNHLLPSTNFPNHVYIALHNCLLWLKHYINYCFICLYYCIA